MNFCRVAAFALVLGLSTAACGSDEGESSGSSSTTGGACASDSRKDVYTAGMARPAGGLSVKIMQAAPSPPAKGTNAFTLEVADGAGNPVDGATVVVTPFMPDHGHGSAVVPVVTAAGGGKYEVAKVYLSMAGLWRITVTVTTSGSSPQEAAFQFCLDG
jgi:hypothetical protein